jgi:hypothetical protein
MFSVCVDSIDGRHQHQTSCDSVADHYNHIGICACWVICRSIHGTSTTNPKKAQGRIRFLDVFVLKSFLFCILYFFLSPCSCVDAVPEQDEEPVPVPEHEQQAGLQEHEDILMHDEDGDSVQLGQSSSSGVQNVYL